jgi:hypothetical protein
MAFNRGNALCPTLSIELEEENTPRSAHNYPQPVDNCVDIRANLLQKCNYLPTALASWRGLRNNLGWG